MRSSGRCVLGVMGVMGLEGVQGERCGECWYGRRAGEEQLAECSYWSAATGAQLVENLRPPLPLELLPPGAECVPARREARHAWPLLALEKERGGFGRCVGVGGWRRKFWWSEG